jgi:hypothetical protein
MTSVDSRVNIPDALKHKTGASSSQLSNKHFLTKFSSPTITLSTSLAITASKMPKAARRASAPRAEPYPAIKPGDKPAKSSKKALAEKSSAEVVNKPSDPSPTEKQNPAKASTSKPKKASAAKPSADTSKPSSFLEVKLDGEDTEDGIPLHDTCSTIRSKINALLGKDNHKPENGIPGQFDKAGKPKPYTKAAFLRDIGGVSAGSLATFLKASKMMGGAESPVYPAAYAFFEKKRIWEGKKKTAGRLKVESE